MCHRIAFVALCAGAAACSEVPPVTAPDRVALNEVTFPDVLPLPDGFWPEGIAFGRGSTFYVGSLATGGIWRGDARTGDGSVLVAPEPGGGEKVGMKYDPAWDRLFVAGGFTGQAFAYDASSGALLASWQPGAPGASLINDVVIAGDVVYFTDSFNPVLYRIRLGVDGALPAADAVETIPLSGEFQFVEDTPIGNANGIAATPDGSRLLVANTTTGVLYSVDPASGHAVAIDLGGATIEGDGILLEGRRLYVVEGHLNRIAVVTLAADMASGSIDHFITHPALRFPSTIASFGQTLYAVNARFDETPAPTTEYEVVRVAKRP